ncbi:hypothetical protein ACFXCP_34425, partial [Streptomyces sp. NPDC059402]
MRAAEGPVHHRVDITDPATWFTDQRGFDPGQDVTTLDWLATPTQRLAGVTVGAVFHDGLNRLWPGPRAARPGIRSGSGRDVAVGPSTGPAMRPATSTPAPT